jgi:hypothetical protein
VHGALGVRKRHVLQADDPSARHMIVLLALDCPFLSTRREEVLRRTLEFLSAATTDELRKLVEGFRSPSDGQLPDFGHVIARFAEQQLPATSGDPER